MRAKKQTSVQIDPSLWKDVGILATQLDLTRTDALESGLAWWLKENGSGQTIHGVEPKSRTAKPFAESKWPGLHDMLEQILQSGNRKAISAVKENLEVFHHYVQVAASDKQPSSKPSPSPSDGETSGKKRKIVG